MHKLTNIYKSSIKKYEDFKTKSESLILELLIQNNLSYHKIESRVKDINRLDEKILRKNDKYSTIDDITDLVGIRIITYLEDDVDKVAEIIASEFNIDPDNSIDKRMLDSDRFGYRSLHYVITLTDERKILTEYKRFKDIKIEVQIRSILQHAWAEIEHDLGYKSEHAIPDIFRRNFYRVAALLETADIEFVNIKQGLDKYEKNVAADIENHPENVEINSASIRSFILSDKLVKYIDNKISINSGCELSLDDDDFDTEYHVKRLLFLNINSIKELEEALLNEKEIIVKFANEWIKKRHRGTIMRGISLFYLCYVLVGKRNNLDFANGYYKTIINQGSGSDKQGDKILEVYKKVS